jgi:hypothetical protein
MFRTRHITNIDNGEKKTVLGLEFDKWLVNFKSYFLRKETKERNEAAGVYKSVYREGFRKLHL